jgi:hypothetical protein
MDVLALAYNASPTEMANGWGVALFVLIVIVLNVITSMR